MNIEIAFASDEDAAQIAQIYRPYVENTPVSFEYEAPDAHEMARRIQRVSASELPWLVAKNEDKVVVGYSYATRHKERDGYRWCVESSVYVDSREHRSGIGRALYAKLFEILRQLGYVNVYAGATIPNEQSERFHASFGFRETGRYEKIGFKLGAWHDTVWWHLALVTPPSRQPAQPLPLSAARL